MPVWRVKPKHYIYLLKGAGGTVRSRMTRINAGQTFEASLTRVRAFRDKLERVDAPEEPVEAAPELSAIVDDSGNVETFETEDEEEEDD